MDAARTALRLGRGGGIRRIPHALWKSSRRAGRRSSTRKEEGVEFRLLQQPRRKSCGYHNPDDRRDPKNGCVTGIQCIKMELGEPDEQRTPTDLCRVPRAASSRWMWTRVIMAIGTSPNPLIKSTTDRVWMSIRRGGIVVRGGHRRDFTRAGVLRRRRRRDRRRDRHFLAMGAGKTAARAIDAYLNPAASPTGQTI